MIFLPEGAASLLPLLFPNSLLKVGTQILISFYGLKERRHSVKIIDVLLP